MRCPAQVSEAMTEKASFCLSLSLEPTEQSGEREGHGSQTLVQGLGVV